VNQLNGTKLNVYAAKAEIGKYRLGLRFTRHVSLQNARLLELLGQGVAIVRIAGKRPGAHDQLALLSNCQADLDTELVGLARLAFADTLDFRRVQCIQLVLVFGALTANAPRSLKPDEHLRLSFIRRAVQLALDVAQQPAQYRSLALEHAA